MNTFTNYTTRLFALLNKEQRKHGYWVLVLLSINTFLDFFSLATFLPLIYLIVNPGNANANFFYKKIQAQFSINSPEYLTIALAIAVLIFVLLKNLFSVWVIRYKSNYVFHTGSQLSTMAMEKYMRTSYQAFTQMDYSKEMNRIANLPIAFANNIINPLFNLISEGILFILLSVAIIWFDSTAFLLLLVSTIPLILIYAVKRSDIKKTSNEIKLNYPLTLKYALQVVEGLFEIKLTRKENFFLSRFKKTSKDLASTFARDHFNQTISSRLTEIFVVFTMCFLIIYSQATSLTQEQTIILISVYAGVSFRLIPSMNRILNAVIQLKSHDYLFTELNTLWKDGVDETDGKVPSFHSRLEIQELSFCYDESQAGLKNISLSIAKGSKILLQGKSGVGKTTLFNLLLRFLTPFSGKILIDGQDAVSYSASGWRTLFGYIPQHPFILDGTIVENIAFGFDANEVDLHKVNQLIEDLNLVSLVRSSPNALHTIIGEKGIKLSGGEKQRISIARALYADAEILLLDEITNQLDPETEKDVFKALELVVKMNKTIIMISHNPSLEKYFDSIFSLTADGISVRKVNL